MYLCGAFLSYQVFLMKKICIVIKSTTFFSVIHNCSRLIVSSRLNNIVRFKIKANNAYTVFSEKCVIDFDVVMRSYFQSRYASGINKFNKVRLL